MNPMALTSHTSTYSFFYAEDYVAHDRPQEAARALILMPTWLSAPSTLAHTMYVILNIETEK